MSAKRGSDQSSYYEILEIDPSASGREVHSAYKRAKETYSPESPALYTMFTPEEARQLLKMIDEAFTVLSNQVKRQEYDLFLARKGHPAFSSHIKAKPTVVKDAAPSLVGGEGAVLKEGRPPQSTNELPEGFARTRFGVYEVNPEFEKEMATIDECDGAYLQKVRQYKKANLEQLSDATRISKSNLNAIENNAYDALPAPVFVRGFVLQLVRILGVPEKLVDAYMKSFRRNSG
jgi:curved DNA-binding protein CbpA